MKKEMRYASTGKNDTYKLVEVSPEFVKCEDEVYNIYFSVKKLIQSIIAIFVDVIPADVSGQVQRSYKDCLTKTITIASDDVDKLIIKYHVTNQLEVDILKERVANLWDDASIILCQG